MRELLRYLVSIDPGSGAIKVEQIGDAGGLTEVDPGSFIHSLRAGTTGASPTAQVVINIYGGGHPGEPPKVAFPQGLPKVVDGWTNSGPKSKPSGLRKK